MLSIESMAPQSSEWGSSCKAGQRGPENRAGSADLLAQPSLSLGSAGLPSQEAVPSSVPAWHEEAAALCVPSCLMATCTTAAPARVTRFCCVLYALTALGPSLLVSPAPPALA